MLNAVWLETFVTLCEVGHFTRAAAALNMTQPGVSQHLRKLEEQVGRTLLSRDGKSFTPTPAGEALLRIGRRRREEEQTLQQQLGHDDADCGIVSIAAPGSLALLLYPTFMRLMQAAPKLVLKLEAAPQQRINDGVAEGTFDLGLVYHAPTHPRLAGDKAGQDELCLLLPKGVAQPQNFQDLAALGFVAHPDGFAHADELLGLNFSKDYPGADRLKQKTYINQIGQLLDPVAQGLGYTVLPRSGVEAYAKRDRLHIAELPHPVRHDLWLIHRKSRLLPARIHKLRMAIQTVLTEGGVKG